MLISPQSELRSLMARAYGFGFLELTPQVLHLVFEPSAGARGRSVLRLPVAENGPRLRDVLVCLAARHGRVAAGVTGASLDAVQDDGSEPVVKQVGLLLDPVGALPGPSLELRCDGACGP